jgi:hypothetical protein
VGAASGGEAPPTPEPIFRCQAKTRAPAAHASIQNNSGLPQGRADPSPAGWASGKATIRLLPLSASDAFRRFGAKPAHPVCGDRSVGRALTAARGPSFSWPESHGREAMLDCSKRDGSRGFSHAISPKRNLVVLNFACFRRLKRIIIPVAKVGHVRTESFSLPVPQSFRR